MSEYNEDTFLKTAVNNILEWSEAVVMSAFAVILIFSFLLRIVIVDGESMMITLFDRDVLVVTHILYEPENGDVIVLESEDLDLTVVKRVIAVEGQTVEIDYNNNNVMVDGEVIYEDDYLKEKKMNDDKLHFDQKYYDFKRGKYFYTVPEDCVFVLGDNRNNSSDSRSFGFVEENEIIGKVVFRIASSYGDLGFIK